MSDCMCTFEGCCGTGIAHCSPPCGGDQCICVCGGEASCDGCENCNEGRPVDRLDDGLDQDGWPK